MTTKPFLWMALIIVAFLALVWAIATFAPPVLAQDMGAWYKSLRMPTTGISCCDISDCKRTQARFTEEGWKAKLPDGSWVSVPETRILWDKEHPTGAAVLCASPHPQNYGQVFCFVPPSGGT